jgi:arsenate reductase-like glutaredoxin family protein
VIVYGIKNCNTVKAAIDWLTKNKVIFEFHDYKKAGITAAKLSAWCQQVS